jgi:hypothetical protein
LCRENKAAFFFILVLVGGVWLSFPLERWLLAPQKQDPHHKIADGGEYVTTSVHSCSGNVRKPSGLQQLNDVVGKNNRIQDDVSNELK